MNKTPILGRSLLLYCGLLGGVSMLSCTDNGSQGSPALGSGAGQPSSLAPSTAGPAPEGTPPETEGSGGGASGAGNSAGGPGSGPGSMDSKAGAPPLPNLSQAGAAQTPQGAGGEPATPAMAGAAGGAPVPPARGGAPGEPSVTPPIGGSAGAMTAGSGGMAGGGGTAGSAGGGIAAGGRATEPGVPRELAPPNATVPNPLVTHVFTADPSAYSFEGRIYVYASHDPDDQKSWAMVDYHVFSTNDLANWQDHGVALDSANIPFVSKLYAPDCAYDAALDKYFLYFPDSGSTIGVAVSDSPAGPFENWKQLVTKKTPGAEDVDWLFDPTAFFDDDGQGYLYFGGGPSGSGDNARVIRLNPDRMSLMDSSATTIIAPRFFEAAFVFKREGTYYFSYSTTFTGGGPTIDYMVSDKPMSGFDFVGTVIPNPEGNNRDNNHHSMVEYKGQWYVFYHNRVLANREGYSKFQRSITLDKMTWTGDRMVKVSATRGEIQQLRSVDAFERIEAELLAGQRGIETDSVMEGGERTGVMVTDVEDGDWIAVSQVDFGAGASTFSARVASEGGGSIQVLQGGCDGFRDQPGTVIGTCPITATGGAQTWTDASCTVTAAAGVHDLCLRFSGAGKQVMYLDFYSFK